MILQARGRLLVIAFVSFLAANASYAIPIVLDPLGSVSLVVGLLFVFVFTALSLFLMPAVFVLYWLQLVLLQNFLAAVWFTGLTDGVPISATEAKSVSMMFAGVLLTPGIARLLGRSRGAKTGAFIYLGGIAVSFGGLGIAGGGNLRNFVVPIVTMLVGMVLSKRLGSRERWRLVEDVLTVATFWLALAAVVELALGVQRWRDFFEAANLAGLNSVAPTTTFLDVTFTRASGLLVEPINTGYVATSLVLAIVAARFFSGTSWHLADYLRVLVGVIVSASTATKNSLLMAVILVAALILLRRGVRPASVLFYSVILGVLATFTYGVLVKGPGYVAAMLRDPTATSGGESTSIHLAGLINGIEAMLGKPLGWGIGSGGNFYRLEFPGISRAQWLGSGSESSWGTLAYQMGVPGMVGLILMIVGLSALRGVYFTALISVWVVGSLFSEAFFGPIASCLLLLPAALLASEDFVATGGPPASRVDEGGCPESDVGVGHA